MNFSHGTSQRDRISAQLAEGFFKVDDLAFQDLLAMAAENAANLRFFDANNATAGDWERFFASDDAAIIALILTADVSVVASEFFNSIDRNISSFGNGYDLRNIPSYDVARRIDYWYARTHLSESEGARNLGMRISNLIAGNLGTELLSLENFIKQFYPTEDPLFRQGFDASWFTGRNGLATAVRIPEITADRETIEQFLRRNFHSFDNALTRLKAGASRLLPLSMQSGTHSPASGLFIAFTQLLKHAQKSLNKFPARHLDFYYDDVLNVQRQDLVPDSTYLIFTPDVADRRVLIKKGNEFPAEPGEDGQPVLYTADNDLFVSGAKVASLATLHFQSDRHKSPELELKYYSGAISNELPVMSASSALDDPDPQTNPVFGAPRMDDYEWDFPNANIGFALASPVLFLKEGERKITFSFTLEHRDPMTSVVTGVDEFFDSFLDQTASLLRYPSRQDAFYKAFREMFTIYLTTESGWYQVPSYLPLNHVVDSECEQDVLKIEVLLPPNTEPVVAYSLDIHGGGYDCEIPVARFMVNPGAYLYPYSLLKDVSFQRIEIVTEVKGVRDLILHNNLGQLDPTSPFNPFGPTPFVGSYLILGNLEIARKNLTHLDFDIEWGNLPTEGRSFADHYRAYDLPFENSVFQAQATVLRDGRWWPQDENERPVVGLFASRSPDDGGEGWNRIKTNRLPVGPVLARALTPLETATGEDGLTYNTLSKTGFFRFSLSSPEYAFGHKEYPLKLTTVLTVNAQLKKPELFTPTPNAPYTPLINSISLDYTAVSTMDLRQIVSADEGLLKEQIFHIHPFGLENLPPGRYRTINMLPHYDATGNLYVGVDAESLTGVITLFFRLREDCLPEAGTGDAEITWHFLSADGWTQLDRAAVISDTTNGFLGSGIVTLNIPDTIARGNAVMPGDLYWLRASAYEHSDAFCSVYSVHAQALKVSWQHGENLQARLQNIIPAGTIKSSRVSIPGIGKIDQIIDSFGGRLPESPQQTNVRTSERLRHKNRALSPWDYERMILQQFPNLLKVKCFPNMDFDLNPETNIESLHRPGNVLIVVVPNPKDRRSIHLKPMVNGLELEEIREFVKKHASPFATIKVKNPVYEQIQVRCTVRFHEGESEGYSLNALDQAISAFLSPWDESIGYQAEFYWKIRRHDIETYIRNLDYVDFITNFSMLHIADNRQGYFHLFDTMKSETEITEITPYYPWSISIPAMGHAIEITQGYSPIEAEVTGVDELEIGTTFIIING
ncbi:MAG: hypothetical protein IH872_06075 [Chloroflexi bacterium]|nr:hypothetical protein [Chloroflexota bacterium]